MVVVYKLNVDSEKNEFRYFVVVSYNRLTCLESRSVGSKARVDFLEPVH